MTTFKTFEDIDVWRKARTLTREIYKISNDKSFSRDFALRDQIRKACCSVMSNIAEGFERKSKNEFIHFLSIAKGSIGEVRCQLYIAFDEQYIPEETFDVLILKAMEISRMISGLMNYLKSSKK